MAPWTGSSTGGAAITAKGDRGAPRSPTDLANERVRKPRTFQPMPVEAPWFATRRGPLRCARAGPTITERGTVFDYTLMLSPGSGHDLVAIVAR